MLYACRTKPLPDDFLTASQASSLLSVDDNGPWFRSIPRSHDFSSPIMLEMEKRFLPLLETDRRQVMQKLCRPI